MTSLEKGIELFLLNNNFTLKTQFDEVVYRCIIDEVAFNFCDKLKEGKELDVLKKKIRVLGERLAIENFTKEINLGPEEFSYISKIIIGYVNKQDGRSNDIQKYKQHLFDGQNGNCAACGNTITFGKGEIDHIIPHSFVGDSLNSIHSLQLLCEECNGKKSKDAWFPIHFLLSRGYFPKYTLDSKWKDLSRQ